MRHTRKKRTRRHSAVSENINVLLSLQENSIKQLITDHIVCKSSVRTITILQTYKFHPYKLRN